MDDLFYLIIYPNGDRSKLSVAEAQYFDKADYDLASEKEYKTIEEACERARELAKRFNKDYQGNHHLPELLE